MNKPTFTPSFFSPLKSTPQPRRLLSFDTEGNGTSAGFVCGAVASGSGQETFTDRQEMLDYLLSPALRSHWIAAHNLEYDLGVLTAGDFRNFEIVFTQASILWAEVSDKHRHKRLFIDTQNIFSGASVQQLGQMVGRAKKPLHPFLQDWINAGRPLAELSADDRWRIISYCARDAEIVYLALAELQEELLLMGGNLKPTVSGCSMDLYRRKFMEEAWPIVDENVNRLARQGYYGARTEPYRLGRVSGVNGYDISSLYPSVMAVEQFPWPGYLHLEENPSNFAHLLDRPGMAQVVITIPEMDPPPLPIKLNQHLFFPTGKMVGTWTNGEIRYAIENGATLERVQWLLWSNRAYNPFEHFITTLYKLRVLHSSDSPIKEHFCKMLLTSAYGRYGINPDTSLAKLIPLRPGQDWGELRGGYFRQIGHYGYALVPLQFDNPPAYANCLIAAQVSAAGRMKMHGYISEYLDSLCYTDTDSLWTTGQVKTGQGLGAMRKTHEDLDLWVVAPKEYAVFSGEHLVDARVKGIPEQYRLDYLHRGNASFQQPYKIREAMRYGAEPSTWALRLKSRQYSFPKRAIIDPDLSAEAFHLTRPWTFPELVETVGRFPD